MISTRQVAGLVALSSLLVLPRAADAASVTFVEEFVYPDVDFPAAVAGQALFIGTDPLTLCDLGTLTCTRAFATVLFDLSATSVANTASATEHQSETIDLGFNVIGGRIRSRQKANLLRGVRSAHGDQRPDRQRHRPSGSRIEREVIAAENGARRDREGGEPH